jgi:hypothetical protein
MIIDPAIRHQRQRLLNCEQRTFHIRIECLIKVFFGNSADWSEAAAAGVRIDDIEPPFFALDLCEELVEVIEVRGVGFDGCRRPVTKTYAPSLTKRWAVARPIPAVPPVTSAIFPPSFPDI